MANSLALISAYESEEEDDQMHEKSDTRKRSLENDNINKDTKKTKIEVKNRLPAPNILLTNAAPKIDHHVDDPETHNGRIRSFAHERGNWTTFVYIDYEENGILEAATKNIIEAYPNLQNINDYHISLTKTFILRHHWIDSFINTVKENVSGLQRFTIMFNGLKIYCNEDKTRTFIGIKISSGIPELKSAVSLLDKSLIDYKLPVFYKDPSFHMSILWCVGDQKEELSKVLHDINELFYKSICCINEEEAHVEMLVDKLICKTGNKLYNIPLINK